MPKLPKLPEQASAVTHMEMYGSTYVLVRYHEFMVEIPHPVQTLAKLQERGFLGGLILQPIFRDLREHVLLCCTERNSSADIDAFVAALAESIR